MFRRNPKKSTETIIDEKLDEFRGEIRDIAAEEALTIQGRIYRDLDDFKQEIQTKLAIKETMRPLESGEKISLKLNPRSVSSSVSSSDSIPDSISESSSSLGLSNDPPSVISSPSSSSESTSNMFSFTFDDEPTSSSQTIAPDSNVHNPFGVPTDLSPEKIGFSDNFGTEHVGAQWLPGTGTHSGQLASKPFLFEGSSTDKSGLLSKPPRNPRGTRRHRASNPLVSSNPNVGSHRGKFGQSMGAKSKSTIKSEDDVKNLYNVPGNWSGGRKTKKRRRHKKKTNKKGQYKKLASRRRRNTRKK